VLQVGLGAFGQNHLRAWRALGAHDLWLADRDPARRAAAQAATGLPDDRIAADADAFLDAVDVVDVVTPTDSHLSVCLAAIDAGKDVFVEKPMTATAADARVLSGEARRRGRILQVGYYYRWHPAALRARTLIDTGALGTLRYISGAFMGFKRARTDVGVTQTDAVHFIDLVNWLVGAFPVRVHAVTRDHFGRGLDDLSIALFDYPGGLVAKIESGYVQPGRWRDRVVAGAYTTKTLVVCGSEATIEIDFEQERLDLHHVRHELTGGVWAVTHRGTETPALGPLAPAEMVAAELASFLDCVEARREPAPNATAAGVKMADIVEAVYASAARGAPVTLADEGSTP
jgi:predicted dehydrogenase